MSILLCIATAAITASVLVIIFSKKHDALKTRHQEQLLSYQSECNQAIRILEKENSALLERENSIFNVNQVLEKKVTDLQVDLEELKNMNAFYNAENRTLKEKLADQLSEFNRLRQQATVEFETIASRILKKNTEEFSEVNKVKINDLLSPLKERIQLFEKKVEDTYEKGLKDQTDLKAELKKLYELNHRISNEANNLTRALKGDVKQQGNWGEMVLERILERSGLTEGQEFEREKVAQNAEGKIIRPDVVVNLPDKKHIIIDSKVSLVAYERYTSSDNPTDREQSVREHLISLRNHIRELSNKHYNSSPNFNTPDFVLLFLPIEASFSVALEQDQQLFNFAWDNKVVLVCPSTLLATLRTIASIWQQENQTRNAMEIAKQSGALYDKFAGFITDMEKLGKSIETTQKTFDEANKKLYTGNGNLVKRIEGLKELGAATSKQIPEKYTE